MKDRILRWAVEFCNQRQSDSSALFADAPIQTFNGGVHPNLTGAITVFPSFDR
jgi:hypothetical protein